MSASLKRIAWNAPIGRAELHALLRVRQRVLERAAREPDRARRGVDAGDVEAVHRRVEGAARGARGVRGVVGARAEQRVGRHAQVVEDEVERRDAVVADLVDRRAGEAFREAVALLLDQEALEAARAVLALGRVRTCARAA